jgi:5'-nucleotidase
MTRILITNDDGIESPGLRRLARAVHRAGHGPVVVAAPASEASGSSASITLAEQDGRVRVQRRELVEAPEVAAYAVAAPPAMITLIATRRAFGPPPDVVISGINRGANTGRVVLHSGTVGAALTAASNGLPALAVSLDVGVAPLGSPHWDTAAEVAVRLLPTVFDAGAPVVVNLNVPDLPGDDVRGVCSARLASFGAVQTNVELGDGYVRMTVADSGADLEAGTDAAQLARGYATVTVLNPVCAADDQDLPGLARLLSTPAGRP